MIFSLKICIPSYYNGVIRVGSWWSNSGIGCAGRGVAKAPDLLSKEFSKSVHPDVVFYDVLGDVVCGGFSMLLQELCGQCICVISSGNMGDEPRST